MENKVTNKLVDFIFNNSQIIVLVFLFLVIAGSFSLLTMKREGFPDVAVNIAMVSVPYPGASATQVEKDILYPLENAISGLDNVTDYQTVASDSFGYAVVTFAEDVDIDESTRELNNKVSKISFPEEASDATVQDFSTGDGVGHFLIGVSGTNNLWDLQKYSSYIEEELRLVDGVGKIEVMTPLVPQIVINFDYNRLKSHGLARGDIEAAIRSSQLNLPVGSFINNDNEQINVGISKETNSINDLRNLKIAPNLTLSNVADIEYKIDNNQYYRNIGYPRSSDLDEPLKIEPSILISIWGDEDIDLLKTSDNLEDSFEEILESREIDNKVKITILYSQAEFTRDQINEIQSGVFGRYIDELGFMGFIGYLFGGIGLILILLLILISARVAIMAAMAIPLSILSASIVLYLLDINLNTIVLFSMILVIGLVVDPTIVFLESIQRFRDQGYTGRDAVNKTFSTVGLGAMLAVMTNILVFVPFGVISGFFGQIVQFIPLTVIPAMLASFLIPVFFFVPIASKILGQKSKISNGTDPELIGVWRISKAVGGFVSKILNKGIKFSVLRVVIIIVALTLPLAIAGASISSGAVRMVQFASQDDGDMALVSGIADSGWDYKKIERLVINPLEKFLAYQPEIEQFTYYQQGGNSFTIMIQMIDKSEYDYEDLKTTLELIDYINEYAKILPADIEATWESYGPPTTQYPINIRVFDTDFEKLKTATLDIREFLEDQEGVIRVEDSLNVTDTTNSGTSFVLDSNNEMNIVPFLAFSKLKDRLSTQDLGEITIGDDEFNIVSKITPEINSINELRDVPIISTPYGDVLTNDLISGTKLQKKQTIERLNGQRYVEIKAKVNRDIDPISIQADLNEYLDEDKLESFGLRENATESRGETFSVEELFKDLFTMLILAIFLIYMILIGFFRSFWTPFTILFAIPLGFIGVFPAVALAGGQLGFLEILGVVVMAGIVVNVTILLVDYANQMRKKGDSVAKAMGTAVSIRFRPIILTQVTAFGSLIPLAVYSPMWRGMALVIVFGIIFSALLSLLTTPILYLWGEAMINWFKGKRFRKSQEQTLI